MKKTILFPEDDLFNDIAIWGLPNLVSSSQRCTWHECHNWENTFNRFFSCRKYWDIVSSWRWPIDIKIRKWSSQRLLPLAVNIERCHHHWTVLSPWEDNISHWRSFFLINSCLRFAIELCWEEKKAVVSRSYCHWVFTGRPGYSKNACRNKTYFIGIFGFNLVEEYRACRVTEDDSSKFLDVGHVD